MSRRISIAIIGVTMIALVLAGSGTLFAARVANRQQTLHRLEVQARKSNELLGSLGGAAVSAGGAGAAGSPTTTAPTGAATSGAALRQRLLEALNVSGIGQVVIGPNGILRGELPAGVRPRDIDVAVIRAGDVVSGGRGNTLWAAAGTENTTVRGRTVLDITVLTTTQERFLGPTFRWFALSAAVALAIAGLVSIGLGRRLGRPVHATVGITGRLAAGDLAARLPQPTADDTDELAALARSINAMADGLERAREQERQFLLSVSHDLRTPMTSIRGYAEAIADGASDDPARSARVILSESRRLERLVGDLLDLAKLDADRFTLTLVSADLADVVEGVVDGFAPELAERGLVLHRAIDAEAAMIARVDVDRLAQLVANLITNAISYANSTVWAAVRRDGPVAVIEISDDGPGIPAAALPHVFDRLYQADNQGDRRGRGTGLGLAIVSELATRLGGRVDVRSVEGSGTSFSVRFPLS